MYKNMYCFLPPAPPCAHDSMVDSRDDYSALFIRRKTACYAPLWLCMSPNRGDVDSGYRFRRLFLPLLFPHFSHAITFSINNLHLHLYFAVSLSYSHFFICHIFHGTGRLILTYSKNSLYVQVDGNIPGILTQGAIQFCSSKFFSCFVQLSISTV